MAPFRNLLKRPPLVTVEPAIDEIQQSAPLSIKNSTDRPQRPSLTIRRSRDGEDLDEYKMSVVDGSGVYLPPSPPETRGSWRSPSRNNSRNLVNENEPFSISRESFESYRRSFDISARSPVSQTDGIASRTSLDSRFSRRAPRSPQSGYGNNLDFPETSAHETVFEDVKLRDESKPRKRGFFARFGESTSDAQPSSPENSRPSSSHHHGFHLPGRKRGQSGQGAELANMTGRESRELK